MSLNDFFKTLSGPLGLSFKIKKADGTLFYNNLFNFAFSLLIFPHFATQQCVVFGMLKPT
jgi:hypothetical protein